MYTRKTRAYVGVEPARTIHVLRSELHSASAGKSAMPQRSPPGGGATGTIVFTARKVQMVTLTMARVMFVTPVLVVYRYVIFVHHKPRLERIVHKKQEF